MWAFSPRCSTLRTRPSSSMIPLNMLSIADFRLPIADWYFPIVASGSAAFRAERLCLSVSLGNIQRLCLG
jgi:hypothetical protein